MFGKVSVLLVAGFAALVSASLDLSMVLGEKMVHERADNINELPKRSVGAFPDGFLNGTILVNSTEDKQWLYDQLPASVQGRPGTLNYRN